MASAAKAFLFLAALTTKSVGKLGRSPPETIVLTWPPAETYAPKYDKAVECLTKDRDALLAFYDFPAEHWKHLRSTNPIESTFATVRHRTIRSKGCLSNKTALAMVFKLIEAAQKSWRCGATARSARRRVGSSLRRIRKSRYNPHGPRTPQPSSGRR